MQPDDETAMLVVKKNSKVAQVLHNKIELTSQKTFAIAMAAASMAAVCQMQATNKGPLRRDSFDDNKDFA